MAVKRSEAEVAGHDPRLRDAVDQLTEGDASGDPLFPDGDPRAASSSGELSFDPHRYQQQTVPPNVLAAMAAVDLRVVDSQGAEEPGDARERVEAPRSTPRVAGLSRLPIVIGAALVLALLFALAMWRAGAAQTPETAAPATSAGTGTGTGAVRGPAPSPAPVETPRPTAPAPVEPPAPAPRASIQAAPSRSAPPAPPAAPRITPSPPKAAPVPPPSSSPGFDPKRPVL